MELRGWKRRLECAADNARDARAAPRQRADTTRGSGLDVLPLPLLREQVFGRFLPSSKSVDALIPHGLDARHYEAQLTTLRAVCRSWRDIAQHLVAEYKKRCMTIEFRTASKKELRVMLRRVRSVCGADVEQLEIVMGVRRMDWQTQRFQRHQDLCDVDAIKIDWDAILRAMPNIVRLDLFFMPIESVHVGRVLRAAATHCPRVQALELPGNPICTRPVSDSNTLQEVLCSALARWKSHNGGLRQLRVPCPPKFMTQTQRDGFLGSIATHCPRIEFLQGVDSRMQDYHFLQQPSVVALASWRSLCETCTELREFEWSMVPFRPEFANAFGSFPKPHLRKLVVVNILGRYEEADERSSLAKMKSLLYATSALRSCELKCAPTRDDSASAYDDMVQLLVERNPLLEEVVLDSNPRMPHLGMTDPGLNCLSALPHLRRVDAQFVMLKPHTIVDWLSRLEASRDRAQQLVLAAFGRVHGAPAHTLRFLLAAEPAVFKYHKISILFDGKSFLRYYASEINKDERSLILCDQLECLVRDIRARHRPSLSHVHVVAVKMGGKTKEGHQLALPLDFVVRFNCDRSRREVEIHEESGVCFVEPQSCRLPSWPTAPGKQQE